MFAWFFLLEEVMKKRISLSVVCVLFKSGFWILFQIVFFLFMMAITSDFIVIKDNLRSVYLKLSFSH